jgi:triosephosphate isomerase
MPRTPIIGGNWKANGSRQEIASLCCTLNAGTVQPGVEVFCAPPTVYIDYTKALLRPGK